jgi:hypothetical protein
MRGTRRTILLRSAGFGDKRGLSTIGEAVGHWPPVADGAAPSFARGESWP